MQDVKILSGVMDTESSMETVDLNDYIEALNITNAIQGDSKTNYSTSVEGNLKVTTLTPAGQNKVVGSKYIKEVGKAYFVRYNSLMYHQIVEFDYNSRTERIVFENITDSNGSILDISASTFFGDINILGDNILVLNSGDGEILQVDINRGRGEEDKLDIEDLTLIRRPLPNPPISKYIDNNTLTVNNLRGKLFQFKSQVEYANKLASAWSHTSDRVVPINEPSDGLGQNTLLSNSMEVTVSLKGVTKAEVIRVAVRGNDGAWLLLKEISYNDILNLPTAFDYSSGVNEIYDSSTEEYKLIFNNDGAYPILDQIDVESFYDSLPLSARSLEVVNGNVLALGGLTEGYDIGDVTASATITYYEPNISNVIIDPVNTTFRYVGMAYSSGSNYVEDYHAFTGKPLEGDKVILTYTARNQPQNIMTSEYTVTLLDENQGLKQTLIRAVNRFTSLGLPKITFTQSSGSQNEYIDIRRYLDAQHYITSVSVKNSNVGGVSTQSINALKNNSSYQVSINMYDAYMRPFKIITGDSLRVNTDSIALTRGLLPQIVFNIEGVAPPEAKYYRIGLTENRTTRKYVTLTGTVNTTTSNDYIIVNLKSLERINENEKDSIISYDFTKGDRVNFIKIIDENGNTVRWFNSPTIDLDVIGFNVITADNETEYLLKARNTSLLNSYINSMNNNEVVMEIYTPKAEDDENSSVYYEVGLTYEINNGVFSVPSDSIRTGDSYYRGRVFRSSLGTNKTISELVADPNFSDNYKSDYWSTGTARTYLDTRERTEYKANIRYSGEFIYGSETNEVNRFYPERIYGEAGGETTRKYGWIQGMVMRNNTLVVIQEHKVGVIPVYRSVIEDNEDNFLVADTSRIFGSVRYRSSDLGCGSSKSSISKVGSIIYFVDDNECLPCRDTETNGTEQIGGKNINFFKEFINRAKSRGAKILGYSHEYKGEYLITIEDLGGILVTLLIDDSVYTDPMPLLTDVSVAPTSKGTSTYNPATGTITYTHDTGILGRDDIILHVAGKGDKIIPLNILEGDKIPDQFVFYPVDNQDIDTLTESNLVVISGINTLVPVTVENGEYSKNGGSFTTDPTTAEAGDGFIVRVVSSEMYEETTQVKLIVGGVEGVFEVTTKPENVSPDDLILKGDIIIEGSAVKVRISIPQPITEDVTVPYFINYSEFGSPFIKEGTIKLLAESTEEIDNVEGMYYHNNMVISSGHLNGNESIPRANTIVQLSNDEGQSVLRIESIMLINSM